MDISDAFTADAIQAADAVLSEDETEDLREWVNALYEERLKEWSDETEDITLINEQNSALWLDLCVHSFMAGRAYGGGREITVEMSPETASAFIAFLSERAL